MEFLRTWNGDGNIVPGDFTGAFHQRSAAWKRREAPAPVILLPGEEAGQAQPGQDQGESGPAIVPLAPATDRPQPTYLAPLRYSRPGWTSTHRISTGHYRVDHRSTEDTLDGGRYPAAPRNECVRHCDRVGTEVRG